MLISIETHITCDFPGPPSPSGSAHEKIRWNGCLFDLILYVQSTIFQLERLSVIKGTSLPGLTQYLARINVLDQGHNAVKHSAPRS